MNKFENAKNNFEKGIKAFKAKELALSEKYFLEGLKYAPESVPLLENLSKVYLIIGDYEKAERYLINLTSLNKDGNEIGFQILIELYKNLNEYWKLNDLIELGFKKKKINFYNYLKGKLFYPKFFKSKEDLEKIRENYLNEIKKINTDTKIEKINFYPHFIKPSNWDLSYDGCDNLKIFKELNKFYNKIYPEIEKLENPKKNLNTKIKIGFISEFFSDHTIMKLFKGIIYKLDKNVFDVYVFHSNKTLNGKQFNEIKESVVLYGHENIILPIEFGQKVREIENKNLDILFYTDIGMSTNLYYLTLLKLAKLQITSWGHGETTGNSKINYFLSSKFLETEGYENKYSENVILSNYLPMYFYKPKIVDEISLEELKIKNHYCCPQSLFKLHPDFDLIIKKILEKDKKAKITFIKDRNGILSRLFINRLKKIMTKNLDKIEFIDRMTPQEYINHCGKASVILDPLYFGAGNSFHESMYYGTPTVTKPTNFLKGRIVTGAYSQMQIDNPPVVKDIDEYADLCVDLANKNILDLKMYYKEQAEKNLYENLNAVKDLENIFKSITN